MEYENKYKEALKRAANLRKDAIDMGESIRAKQCEIIFPELKESEDEKIRKVLIDYFKRYKDEECGIKTFYGIPTDDILAWLEKQGEQKRLDFPYVTGWRENRLDNKPQTKHSVLMLTTHGVAEGEWLGKEWCQYRWSCKVKDADVLYWLHLSDLESLEKENFEQKPQGKSALEAINEEKVDNANKLDNANKVEPKFHKGEWITIKE